MERGVAREVDRRVGEPVVRPEESAGCRRRTGRRRTSPALRTASSRPGPRSRPAAGSRSPTPRSGPGRSPRTRSPGRRRSGREARRSWRPGPRRPAGHRSPRARPRPRASPATRSIATIRDAPARTAPITHDSPTPPSPMIATLAPAGTSAVLSTAPTPVETQQPISAATAGSTPSGSGIAAASLHDSRAGHRPDRAIGQDGLAALRGKDGRAVRAPVAERRRVGARPGLAGPARPADPARNQPGQRDGLSHPQVSHAGPDRLDHAGALVTHGDRRGARPLPVADVEVRVADARRLDPDTDLASPWLGDGQGLDRDGLAERPQDDGPYEGHCSPARRRSAWRTGTYGTYAGHHIASSMSASTSVLGSTPARPASMASRATAVAIALVTARRVPTGG